MAKIDTSFLDIGYLDTLAYQDSPIQRLDPRVKLLTTLVFIVLVVSFDKYAITGLIPFVIYPVVMVALGNLPAGFILKKMLWAAPFAFFIGIFNPLLDRHILLYLGPVGISGGWVSFASIMLRFFLTVSAAFILIACTGFNTVCMALEKMGVPKSLATQLLFLYRYIFVLGEEAARLTRARSLRSFNGKGKGIKVFGHMIGQLLLRTLDRAQRLHTAMLCRGFDGEIRLVRTLSLGVGDLAFFLGWTGLFILLRWYNLTQMLGNLVTELIR
ncbi:MAG: cobalt ECF transporter T component CbiQ [Syntrophobacterales bacterium]|jgi:cobalt/nickel transport system permease protein|nr:cobalt ECF transporter T component CbiQ [Syntrophobacterales bacterium]